MTPAAAPHRTGHSPARLAKKAAKRIMPVALAVYFFPVTFGIFFSFGLLDFLRNQRRTLSSFDRYFAGNGFFTWLLSPFNLLMDVFALPYRNKGIYRLSDLPQDYQNEINSLIDAAHRGDLVARLDAKLGEKKRGMIFFKWYGKNVQTSIDVPEFHQQFRYIRTIGVSIFNTRQSTGKHFGPLRVTLRVLYNINPISSPDVYIKVGHRINRWRDNKLFIFDDTLQHQSCNQSDEVRYCLFVDILRPSGMPRVMGAILSGVRTLIARFNYAFYKHWAFIK
ncbi:MAG TPA: aspartyl/asparaginyl beta-hydroxylase domain-containing protein [Gemmataceae bacterium]|jgi:beta-hydroxylase|nr:aspartyl/asparaginyl beta-hydroxylase domain-containing protein [Gemmataceae bacterium]